MKKKPHAPNRYPWGEWLGRARLTLRKGRDYDCSTSSIALMVRRAAKRRGVEVSIETPDDGRIVVTVVNRVKGVTA